MAQFAGHINLFPAIVRVDLSGADPELTASASSAYLCYPVLVLTERKVEREDRQRDDELRLAIWALFLQRPQIKTQPVWRGGGIELSKGNNTSNLFLPLCIFKRGEEEERRFNN